MYAELGTQVGLRRGELSGLHGHRVDWLRSQITVVDVMTRQGPRQYPKSRRSHRVAPVPPDVPDVLEGLSVLMTGRPRDALVFTAPEGGPVGDVNFRNRVWWPAVAVAGIRRPAGSVRSVASGDAVAEGLCAAGEGYSGRLGSAGGVLAAALGRCRTCPPQP
jgi:hypothetical protein